MKNPFTLWMNILNFKKKLNIFTYDLHRYLKFYICSPVHHNSRLKKSNEMQQYADIYLLLNYSTCFGRPSRPSSGAHKTVVAASGIGHSVKYKSTLLVQLLYFTV